MKLIFKIIIIGGFAGLAITALTAIVMDRAFTGLIAIFAMILILITAFAE